MIMIDYQGFREQDIAFHDMTQPRGLSWAVFAPPARANVIVFRDSRHSLMSPLTAALVPV
jgi:hypothetical protein